MEDYFNDSARLRIELEKADSLRELRPHLQKPARGSWLRSGNIVQGQASEKPIRAYLARIVHVCLLCLIDSQILRPDVDIEAFTDRALEEAKKFADNAAVNSIADEARESLVDITRVGYLMELNRRRQEWDACPIYSVVDYDPEEEARIRASWDELRAQREAEAKAQADSPSANPPPTTQSEPEGKVPESGATLDHDRGMAGSGQPAPLARGLLSNCDPVSEAGELAAPHGRAGRRANELFNYSIADIVNAFGADWRCKLGDICEALDEKGIVIPSSPKWRKSGCSSWEDVNDEDPEGLTKAIQHRLDWVSEHPRGDSDPEHHA